ncbi:MFS transporter [Kutzneria viridogrisea]|uniref:Major facilitator superfamily (MFS) profile domain-containing protein n=2 Tax=Kutzneria TaxID=43356 RepID=W5W797_9PSEU|nr:MFS transporter [Kutzneria albida]AHH97033.1 hypothetical protein KALB_3669 [Kutzneria albida DSM 43870]MBA8932000.1 MFS family permease [Kutzneria viridogrisea]
MTATGTARTALGVFLTGTAASRVGDNADLLALNWYVLERTNSPVLLGLVNVLRLAPIVFCTAPAGWLADRYDRRRLLAGTRILLFAATLGVAIAVADDGPLWILLAAVLFRALAGCAEPVLRQTMLPLLRGTRPLATVVAMHSACLNLAMVVGPAIGSLLLACGPLTTVFWFNAGCSLISLCCLTIVPVGAHTAAASKPAGAAVSVWNFIRANPVVRAQLALAVGPMLFAFPYTSLMPLLATDLLHGDASTVGVLLTSGAAGALAASVSLSRWPMRRPGRLAAVTGVALGGALLGLLLSALLAPETAAVPATVATMVAVGIVGQTYRTANRAALQLALPEGIRGRILGIANTDRALIPAGTALLAPIAQTSSPRIMLLVMGVGCVLLTLAATRLSAGRHAERRRSQKEVSQRCSRP